jgi:hypothetical protein
LRLFEGQDETAEYSRLNPNREYND